MENKSILSTWAEEATGGMDINLPGISDLSVNAHNLNAYITLLRTESIQNKQLLKLIAITCGRIVEGLEKMEAEKVAQAEQADSEPQQAPKEEIVEEV